MCSHKIAPPQKKGPPVYIYIYKERERGRERERVKRERDMGRAKLWVLRKVCLGERGFLGRSGLCP